VLLLVSVGTTFRTDSWRARLGGLHAEDQLPEALSMVIRTKYRGQRYSMGSSDPLLDGFEIRFGSLNFKATGNGYLMRITNRDELRARRATRPGPVPVAPTVDAPASAAGPSAPQHRRRSGQRFRQVRAERRRAARVVTHRDAIVGETATAPTGECAVSRPRFPLGLRGAATAYATSTNTDAAMRGGGVLAAMSRR
jgi:hypothetical protein